MAVKVGDDTVVSDANGNYDRGGFPAGTYRVALAPGQGTAAQASVIVTLAAGTTAIQHLALRSAPTAATATPAAVAPAALPRTGGSADGLFGPIAFGAGILALGFWMLQCQTGQLFGHARAGEREALPGPRACPARTRRHYL